MNGIVSLCVFGTVAMVAMAAPTLDQGAVPQPEGNLLVAKPEFVREKRSQYASGYGAPAYGAPCGGVAPYAIAPLPAVAPIPSGYLPLHGGGGGYGGAGVPHGPYGGGGYGGGPHYRADDMGDDHEMFPDMDNIMTEHIPMARSYGGYGGLPSAHGVGLSGLAGLGAGVSGPAYGVFPNANVGGCNVPLLLSCSPSIVPGRLVKSGYGGGAAYGGAAVYGGGVGVGAGAYRGADEVPLEAREDHLNHEEQTKELPAATDNHPTSSHQ